MVLGINYEGESIFDKDVLLNMLIRGLLLNIATKLE